MQSVDLGDVTLRQLDPNTIQAVSQEYTKTHIAGVSKQIVARTVLQFTKPDNVWLIVYHRQFKLKD